MATPQTENIYPLRLLAKSINTYPDGTSQVYNFDYSSISLGFLLGSSGSVVIGSRQSFWNTGIYDNVPLVTSSLRPRNPIEEWSTYGGENTSNNILFGGSGNRMYGNNLSKNAIIGGTRNKISSGSENYVFGISNEVKNHLRSRDGNLIFGIENKAFGKENVMFGYQNYIGDLNSGHNNILIFNGQANSVFSKNPNNNIYNDSFYQTYPKISGSFLNSHSFLTILNGTCNFIGGEFSSISNGSFNKTIGSFTNLTNGSGNDFTTDYSFGGALTNSRVGGKNIFISNSSGALVNYLDKESIFFNSSGPNPTFQFEGRNLILDGDQSLKLSANQKWVHNEDRGFDLKLNENNTISNNLLYNSSFNNSGVCSSENYSSLIINSNSSNLKDNKYLTSFNLRSSCSVFGASCHNSFLFIDEDGQNVSGSFSTSIGSNNSAFKSNYATSFGRDNKMNLNSGILILGSNVNLNSGLSGVTILRDFKKSNFENLIYKGLEVSNAGWEYVNRKYIPFGFFNGKIWYSGLSLDTDGYALPLPSEYWPYNEGEQGPSTLYSIWWDTTVWRIGNNPDDYYYSEEDVLIPHLALEWVATEPSYSSRPFPNVNNYPTVGFQNFDEEAFRSSRVAQGLAERNIPILVDNEDFLARRSNSMYLNFDNGIFIDSLSGLYLNGKNFRRNFKGNRHPIQLSGLFV